MLQSFRIALTVRLREKLFQRSILESEIARHGAFEPAKLLFPEHPQSHAASAFYPSPFSEAAVLTMDGVGEWATTSAAFGKDNRLEILKEILPKLSRVVTFYNPGDPVAPEAAKLAREEAGRLGLKFIERHVSSVEELRKVLRALKPGEADAYFYVPDVMVIGQVQLIIDTAKAKKLATMFHERSLVTNGALASYGQNYYEIGRVSAKYVQRVLSGVQPRDLKVETIDDVELAINLQTAKQLGLTIPPNVLARAKKVIK